MENESTTARQTNLAGTIERRPQYSPMESYDISIGQRRRYISRFERRLQQKRRGLTPGTTPSRPSADYTGALAMFGLVLLLVIEAIQWLT